MSDILSVGSLFSGIGGIDLGLERAGMKIAWQVEIDEFCLKVLRKHWPEVPKYGDIRKIDPKELEPVDLIAGGFPCQPVSIAGKKLAQKDERWLWPEFARIIRMVRPKYVLVENVPGLLIRGMGNVLGNLAALGYDAEWFVLPASTFLSLPTPQARDWKGAGNQTWSLPRILKKLHGSPCYPSPQLYESVMGFPITWTELED